MPVDILICIIFLLAGFIQGVTGFGSGLLAMPLLVFLIDAKTAVPLCMLNGVVITFFLAVRLRKDIEWKKIQPLFLGCLPGIYVGVTFLKEAGSAEIKLLLGLILIAYCMYALCCPPKPRRLKPIWAYLAGFGTGVIAGAFSAGGPPTIVYTTQSGWSKATIKATLTGFFLATGLLIASAHAFSGLTTAGVLHSFAISVIFVLAGTWAGSFCYDRIQRDSYLKTVHFLLILLGTMMIVSGFRELHLNFFL
ncbi:MAG: sulfite exporter TauE/SafE family protein [Desulfobulbaceae bacterium]|nr:sulfite exporter TauE/SafE family protein [Desulfobulbaceae bacterium]